MLRKRQSNGINEWLYLKTEWIANSCLSIRLPVCVVYKYVYFIS